MWMLQCGMHTSRGGVPTSAHRTDVRWKVIHFPSGDHAGPSSPQPDSSGTVIARSPDPSRLARWIAERASTGLVKAIEPPSGDHAGSAAGRKRRIGAPASGLTTSASYDDSTSPVKRICDSVGDQSGA